jgi:hypothetical protein
VQDGDSTTHNNLQASASVTSNFADSCNLPQLQVWLKISEATEMHFFASGWSDDSPPFPDRAVHQSVVESHEFVRPFM